MRLLIAALFAAALNGAAGASANAQGAPDPEDLFRSGRVALATGDFAAATRTFRRLVEVAPEGRSYYYLGVALLQHGEPADAVVELRAAEALTSGSNPALALSLGTALLRSGDSEAAVSVLTEAVPHHPLAAVPILLQLGYTHYARLDGESAREVLLKARSAAPDNPLAHFYLGLAESALGSLDAAAVAFAEAVRLAPNEAEHRVALGRTMAQLGRPADAREQYEAALAATPGSLSGSPAALVGLGMLDLADGDPEAAVGFFEAALEEAPRHRQALWNLASALGLLGRQEEAAEVRKRFHELAEEEGPARSLSRTAPRR